MRILESAFLTLTVLAVSAETRPLDHYRSIVDRNPFGLRPPPTPPPPQTNTPPPVVKKTEFYLTGISSIGYPRTPKTVYLVNKDTTKKDYADKFYKLRTNEPQGDVSLEEIDERERRVKIKAAGDEIWLSMKDNAMPAGAAPVGALGGGLVPGIPVMPGVPGQAAPPPGMAPVPLPGSTTTAPSFPVNQPAASNRRIIRGGAGNTTGSSFPAPTVSALAPGVSGPSISFGANGQPTDQVIQNNPGAAEPQVDLARQYLELKLQEEQNRRAGKIMPPIPNLTP